MQTYIIAKGEPTPTTLHFLYQTSAFNAQRWSSLSKIKGKNRNEQRIIIIVSYDE
jgi:hypothetical protein